MNETHKHSMQQSSMTKSYSQNISMWHKMNDEGESYRSLNPETFYYFRKYSQIFLNPNFECTRY